MEKGVTGPKKKSPRPPSPPLGKFSHYARPGFGFEREEVGREKHRGGLRPRRTSSAGQGRCGAVSTAAVDTMATTTSRRRTLWAPPREERWGGRKEIPFQRGNPGSNPSPGPGVKAPFPAALTPFVLFPFFFPSMSRTCVCGRTAVRPCTFFRARRIASVHRFWRRYALRRFA